MSKFRANKGTIEQFEFRNMRRWQLVQSILCEQERVVTKQEVIQAQEKHIENLQLIVNELLEIAGGKSNSVC